MKKRGESALIECSVPNAFSMNGERERRLYEVFFGMPRNTSLLYAPSLDSAKYNRFVVTTGEAFIEDYGTWAEVILHFKLMQATDLTYCIG